MTTYYQLVKKPKRSKRIKKNNRPALLGAPHRKVQLIKVNRGINKKTGKESLPKPAIREVTPRKPNSGKRKVARIRVKVIYPPLPIQEKKKNRLIPMKYVYSFAYLPGEGTKMKRMGICNDAIQGLKDGHFCWIRGGRTKDVPGLKYKLMHLHTRRNKKGRIQRSKRPGYQKPKKKRDRAEGNTTYPLQPLVVLKKKRSKYGNKYIEKGVREDDRLASKNKERKRPIKQWKHRFTFH